MAYASYCVFVCVLCVCVSPLSRLLSMCIRVYFCVSDLQAVLKFGEAVASVVTRTFLHLRKSERRNVLEFFNFLRCYLREWKLCYLLRLEFCLYVFFCLFVSSVLYV